jgi:hypothetical protein
MNAPNLHALFLAELRDAQEPARCAVAMATALRDYLGHLIEDDPGDTDVRDVPLIVRGRREADALARTLHRFARGGRS